MHCMRHVHVLTSEPAFFGGYQAAPIHVDIHWLFILQVFIALFEVSSFSIQTQCPTILSVLASLLSADLSRWKSEWVWELLLARLFSGQGERHWVCIKEAYMVFHQALQSHIEQKQLTAGKKIAMWNAFCKLLLFQRCCLYCSFLCQLLAILRSLRQLLKLLKTFLSCSGRFKPGLAQLHLLEETLKASLHKDTISTINGLIAWSAPASLGFIFSLGAL